jgi:hypothetical protein
MAFLHSGEFVQHLAPPVKRPLFLPTQVVPPLSQRLKFQRLLESFSFSVSMASQWSEMLTFSKRPRKDGTHARALVVGLAPTAAAGAGWE